MVKEQSERATSLLGKDPEFHERKGPDKCQRYTWVTTQCRLS